MLLKLGVDRFLELLAGLELRRLAGGNLRRLAGPGITTLARRSIGNGEGSEAGQGDLFAARQRCRDRDQRRVQGLGDGSIGLVGGSGDGGDQVGLVHGGALWVR